MSPAPKRPHKNVRFVKEKPKALDKTDFLCYSSFGGDAKRTVRVAPPYTYQLKLVEENEEWQHFL